MKTTSTLPRFLSLAALAGVVVLSACSKTRDANATHSASTTPSSSTPSSTAATATTGSSAMAVNANETWANIKDYSYDKRAEFAAKTDDYAAQLDRDLQNAKGDASKRIAEARDELRTAATEISNATADTWATTKERVGRAWQKAESATQNVAE